MTDIEVIFRYKAPDWEKLLQSGFELSGHAYRKIFPIMKKQFNLTVFIEKSGEVHYKVNETDTNEEYALIHVENAAGGFVGDMRSACEKVLVTIANKCFRTEILKGEQTKRILSHMKTHYDAEPEFLWEKYPNYAAFRRKENEKWFALILTVDKSKIGLSGHGNIEIMDLKDMPENIAHRLEEQNFFPAYHMNKKHWYTICLDGSFTDEEIMEFISVSYHCAI